MLSVCMCSVEEHAALRQIQCPNSLCVFLMVLNSHNVTFTLYQSSLLSDGDTLCLALSKIGEETN